MFLPQRRYQIINRNFLPFCRFLFVTADGTLVFASIVSHKHLSIPFTAPSKDVGDCAPYFSSLFFGDNAMDIIFRLSLGDSANLIRDKDVEMIGKRLAWAQIPCI